MAVNTSCMFSVVKNTSGHPRFFGFLPPHGRKLKVNESYTVFGDIYQAVQKDVERVTSRRHMAAFEAAIERGDLEIIQTPAPILQDTSTKASKMLKLTGGVVGVADPCWHGTGDTDYEPF